jgi:hypothetical protein
LSCTRTIHNNGSIEIINRRCNEVGREIKERERERKKERKKRKKERRKRTELYSSSAPFVSPLRNTDAFNLHRLGQLITVLPDGISVEILDLRRGAHDVEQLVRVCRTSLSKQSLFPPYKPNPEGIILEK